MYLLSERRQLLEHYTHSIVCYMFRPLLATIGQILQQEWKKIPSLWPPMHSFKNGKMLAQPASYECPQSVWKASNKKFLNNKSDSLDQVIHETQGAS
jgi:hypothetical protein